MLGQRNIKQLQTLLRVRKRQEDIRAQALAEANRALHAARAQREAFQQERQRILVAASDRTHEEFDADDIRRYYQYERHLSYLIDKKDAELGELAQRADESRQELEEAMKKRRMIERLDENRQRQYDAHVAKQEQKLSDEVAGNRTLSQRRGGPQ